MTRGFRRALIVFSTSARGIPGAVPAESGPELPARYMQSGGLRGFSHPPENSRDESPCGIHLVISHVERRISEHGVQQQPLIRIRQVISERGPVGEIHVHRAHFSCGSGYLQIEAHGDPLLRLDPEGGTHPRGAGGLTVGEKQERRLLEVNRDLRRAPGEHLARPQEKWNPGPPPGLTCRETRRAANVSVCESGSTALFFPW